ncbi:MAG: sporulation protein YunB [Clostridia bacterium]|nr:sporulation protein YunB [Clostridia bacterium]
MRRTVGRRDYRRTARIGLCLLLVLFLLVAGIVSVDGRLRPLIQNYGYMSARRSAMMAVHTGVERVLSDESASYGDFITVLRNDEGRVMSAETDVAAVNRLKAAVSNAVMQELSSREKQVTRIPLGSLIGGSFFTGRGPFLPVTIHTSGAVITTLSGEFTDAGINQTKHSLYLDMTVMMTAALPLERMGVELTTRFLVCETVFVGEVPETVLQVDFGDSIDKFFGATD